MFADRSALVADSRAAVDLQRLIEAAVVVVVVVVIAVRSTVHVAAAVVWSCRGRRWVSGDLEDAPG